MMLIRNNCYHSCKTPNCSKILHIDSSIKEHPKQDSMCDCSALICLACKEPGHQPLPCDKSKFWTENAEMTNDRLNLLWIETQTKKCP
jgi:hypothetical protein